MRAFGALVFSEIKRRKCWFFLAEERGELGSLRLGLLKEAERSSRCLRVIFSGFPHWRFYWVFVLQVWQQLNAKERWWQEALQVHERRAVHAGLA